MSEQPELHARATDLPGWPSPPRVSDIPNTEDSWGWAWLSSSPVVQDDIGRLWADGEVIPAVSLGSGQGARVLLAWTPDGLSIYIAPTDYYMLRSKSTLDMHPERWIPIRRVLSELPAHVKNFQ